nr:protein kinase [Ktedonobacteraceae bacterium]
MVDEAFPIREERTKGGFLKEASINVYLHSMQGRMPENEFMREQGQTNEQHGTSGGSQSKSRFGNYDLIRRIDVGGMGEVYLARQRTTFDREVAIKIIRSDLVHDAAARKRFLREAEVNAYIKHEHILPLFEFGEEQGRLFMVTPYIEGGNLARRLQAGPLAPSEVHALFTALVKAVAYIHRHGVVHRDLKPSNILLDQDGTNGQVYVRLIDFGIATIQGAEASPPLTSAGTEVGTLAYMAPERLSGVAAPSNDIYSLGIILHQMLTGKLPAADQHMSLPQPLEYVIKRCIAPQPSDRFTTADDLLSSFEYAYQYLKSAPPKPAAPLSIPPIPTASSPAIPVIPNRMSTPRPTRHTNPQIKSLPLAEEMPPLPVAVPVQRPHTFGSEDYASPTVDFDISQVSTQRKPASAPSLPAALPTHPKKRRNPLPTIITLLIVFILLTMVGLFFFEFQPALAATANVNFGPQVQVVKQIFHLKGSSSQSNIDVNTSTIPVKVLNSSKSGTLSGQTTQQCIIIFGCQQVVTQDDVDRLSAQLRQSLDKQIQQDLQQQVQNKGGTQVGSTQITDAPAISNPQVGTPSKTVTVTITGQKGQGAYFSNQDARTLALLLLKQQTQQLGANYTLLNASIQIGQPAYEGIDTTSGQVLIAIAAAGMAQYRFPASQLNAMQKSLKGMKLANANVFVKQQPGVDPASVSIHISSGAIMPSDVSKIKMITVNPTTFPTFTLPQVTPVPTSTTLVTPVASLTPAQ